MPEYLISQQGDIPKYAKISTNGKSLTWSTQAEASGFGTQAAAREAFNSACGHIMAAGKEKMRKAAASGALVKTPAYQGFCFEFSGRTSSRGIALFIPYWLDAGWQGGKLPASSFPDASRPAPDDLLGVFEQFFLRSESGWLCRPQAKHSVGRLEWNAAFGLAVAFFSEEAAQAELAKRPGGGWVVRTSCVFTGISANADGPADHDDVSRSIAAACEARDIRESLDQSVQSRLAAMRDPEAPKKSPRL